MIIHPTIEMTEDGSKTMRHPIFCDSYHSLRGAVGESYHVFIEEGLRWAVAQMQTPFVRIFEVGFGSGLNALLTAQQASLHGWQVEYCAVEAYPVATEVVAELGYGDDSIFEALHEAKWGQMVRINEWFSLKKKECRLQDYQFKSTFDLVYFDAFAFDTQPEMWGVEVFAKIAEATAKGGALVTYSSKGVVKRNLREAGFEVSRLPGAMGKRHMIRAVRL